MDVFFVRSHSIPIGHCSVSCYAIIRDIDIPGMTLFLLNLQAFLPIVMQRMSVNFMCL